MERTIFYFDAVFSMRQRIFYGLWAVIILIQGFVIRSDNPEIGFLFWVYLALGIFFIVSIAFQPYLKKVLGRRYVMFHNDGITWKLKTFGEEQHFDQREIQSVYFHPTSLDIQLENGITKHIRYPELYDHAQDFRSKAVRWVRELDIPWEDWRERRQAVS